jgi:polysaccharide export outer membrane protein
MIPATLRHVLAALVTVAIGGCSADLGGSASIPTGATRAAFNSVSEQPEYQLTTNDKVRIKVFGETDISGEYEIDAGGFISIPLGGSIKAAGRTTKQLERAVAAALSKGMLRDPRVNVEIAQHRPYYILGEVKRAGEYAYKPGMTVMDAIASAGGFTYRANESKAYVRRAGAAADETLSLDTPIAIAPGDNIRIPERYF